MLRRNYRRSTKEEAVLGGLIAALTIFLLMYSGYAVLSIFFFSWKALSLSFLSLWGGVAIMLYMTESQEKSKCPRKLSLPKGWLSCARSWRGVPGGHQRSAKSS